ncbi:MAG: winged helix-turn-helix transcriptional regulator [Actinobacteria bacterium]|nr:winged helix-turn-helix transcriptional regulator [Actinomycetota bacterium]
MLPGLELLSHELRFSPLAVKILPSAAARFDLLLIDGTGDARRARAACLELLRDCPAPRLLVASQATLPAITPAWGVTDVLVPEASPAEIELRLRLALEGNGSGARSTAASASDAGTVSSAGVEIDEGTFTARVHNRTLDLTYKEFELLHFLAKHPGRVFTRDQLLSEVWGTDYFGGVRTVDVHVRRLRAKLGDHEALISTVRGVGYGFARDRNEEDE